MWTHEVANGRRKEEPGKRQPAHGIQLRRGSEPCGPEDRARHGGGGGGDGREHHPSGPRHGAAGIGRITITEQIPIRVLKKH